MKSVINPSQWRSGLRAIPGTLLVGLVTFICYGLGLNLTATSLLYLIVVVLQSLLGDFVSSAIVSVIADLCLNFFFVPPIFSLRVSDSSDTWALITFLLTGLVITRLTTQVRQEGEISELQRRDMKLLYQLAQQLLALDPGGGMLSKSVALFRTVFGMRAACLFDGTNAELYSAGDSPADLADRTRAAYIERVDGDDTVSAIHTRPLQAGGKTIGAVGFEGLRNPELTAGPLAALAAAILERAHVFRNASYAAAAAQAEVFRGAILDALAHEFKTPLATIVTASSGLREIGGLRPEQLQLAELAEVEASRLARLTSRLLRVARLDREEVKPQLEIIDALSLVSNLVQQYSARWTDRKFSVTKAVESAEVSADSELIQLALRQLLDNAAKYSPPGSEIEVDVRSQDGFVTVRVWNDGRMITRSEREKIFDRFYRGSQTRDLAPGSGLGLYVARKIALAHGGTLQLEPEIAGKRGTAFLLTLPAVKSEALTAVS